MTASVMPTFGRQDNFKSGLPTGATGLFGTIRPAIWHYSTNNLPNSTIFEIKLLQTAAYSSIIVGGISRSPNFAGGAAKDKRGIIAG